jgi:hypothetical protein
VEPIIAPASLPGNFARSPYLVTIAVTVGRRSCGLAELAWEHVQVDADTQIAAGRAALDWVRARYPGRRLAATSNVPDWARVPCPIRRKHRDCGMAHVPVTA